RNLSLLVRREDLRPLKRGVAACALPQHGASASTRRAYRRNVRGAPGESHLAPRVDDRDSTLLGRAGVRAAALRSACAQGTLLRDSRLSVFTNSFSPR